MYRTTAALLALAALAACAAQDKSYPHLVPADTILSDQPLSPSPDPALQARAAALRAQAAAIRAEGN